MARPHGRRWGLAVIFLSVVAAILVAAPSSDARARYGTMSFLDNGRIRIGVSLSDGGKIEYLGTTRGPLAHNLAQGVGIEQSYYGGPADAYWQENADNATVIANRNDGRTIYTKVIAQQPYPTYQQCQCIFETWISLEGNTVHVRNRLTNFRTDGNFWFAHWQELPALYTSGDAYRLFTYDGDRPYTNLPVREITDDRGGFFSPGPSFRASEHWAALLNDEQYGVGLFDPHFVRFNGIPGTDYGTQWEWVNGYMTTSAREILDPNISYTYDYTLIVGSIDDIRAYAVNHRPDPRPVYRFRSDRQHWYELNATDSGWPIRGALRVLPDRDDPQLLGPETEFPASSVYMLYIRGAWHTRQAQAQLFWDTNGFTENRSVIFPVTNDGRFHTYRLQMSGDPGWVGMVHGLRLDPVRDAELGSWIDITCISWKPCPRDARAERALGRTRPVTFHDSFDDRSNPNFWAPSFSSDGTAADVYGGRFVLTAIPDARQAPGADSIAAGLTSRCTVGGNYDVRVDYRLLSWQPANGVHVRLSATTDGYIERRNTDGEAYFVYFPPNGREPSTTDTVGTLRLVRRGGIVLAYVGHDAAWTYLGDSGSSAKDTSVQLSIWSNDAEYAHQGVQVAFDNFQVVRGRISC